MIHPALLQNVSSLKDLSPLQLEQLADRLVEFHHPAQSTVLREGQRAQGLCLLLTGQLDIVRRVPGSGREMATSIPQGEWFGMVSVMDGLPATATLRARDEVTIAMLSRESFFKLLGSGDPLGALFLRAMLRCLALQLERVNGAMLDLKAQVKEMHQAEELRT